MTLLNLIKAIADQPFSEWRNGNAWGIFSRRSHCTRTGKTKVVHPTKIAAAQHAISLAKKNTQAEYAVYKCAFCSGFHVGRNQ